ncbi:MAG: ECF transporter S component [Candidatus Izimaplasma sp.]|nr:ECF transporter S component [Candidatus Izimaplasma bacterium]
MRNNKVLQIVIIANLSALSVLFYFVLKFPLPFIFPSFLDIQFSNLPAIIGGFVLGPIGGGAIVFIRTLIKLPFSTTAGAGELIDLIIGLSTVLTSSIIYKRMKTKKGAIIASLWGMFAWVFVAVMANYLFVIDFYIAFYFNGAVEPLVGMLSIIPGVTTENYMSKYILFAAIPFNILLSSIVYLITFLVYKRISHLIDYFAVKLEKK